MFFKRCPGLFCALVSRVAMTHVYFRGLETQIQEFPSPKIKYSLMVRRSWSGGKTKSLFLGKRNAQEYGHISKVKVSDFGIRDDGDER
jgi:hypothetical protein